MQVASNGSKAHPVILSIAKDLKNASKDAAELCATRQGPEKFNTGVEGASEILRYAQDDRGGA
jgi:hypothetical protein